MTDSIYTQFAQNIILNTDSYKVSHYLQYPPGTEAIFGYGESRGGRYPETLFFGLQMFIKEYLDRPVTREMVEEAKAFYAQHLPGVPFNEAGWLYIIDQYGGYLPVRIQAVPEGSVVPTGNVLFTIESTDPQVPWISQYLETALLRAIWYPTTVATQSWQIKRDIKAYLEVTGESTAGLGFKLHDFGARGVSSFESAAIGGAAHLVNFQGSDNIIGAMAANRYYNAEMAAYSIAAAEHSTITAWGRENEVEAYRNMLTQFAKPGSLVAVVSDSYDIYNAVDSLWGGELRDAICESGATVVIRPDSGDPVEVVTEVAKRLNQRFGSRINKAGYRELFNVRIIQGDGVNQDSIRAILQSLMRNGFSTDNVAFGMGGALLQQVDRDTQKFAVKASAIQVDGQWRNIFKDPVTDQGKVSKKGRLTLATDGQGRYRTLQESQGMPVGFAPALETVYRDGLLTREETLDQVRARADAALNRQPATILRKSA